MRAPLLTFIATVGLSASAAANGPATAQQPPAATVASAPSSAPAEHRPDIIVTGDRAEFESRLSAYVNQLTDFNFGDSNRGLARWQEAVCPLVTGLPRQMAEYVLLRVSEIARAAGAPLAGEKCRSQNLFVIVTKTPEAYLRELQKRHGQQVFGPALPIVVDDFITTPRPARSWYDTVEMTPEGLPLLQMSFSGITNFLVKGVLGGTVVLPVASNDPAATLTNPWSQASHLVLNVVWAMKRVYIIIDPTKFKGVKLGQLADYIAMAGLAQIKLDPKVAGDPTILTLFDGDPQTASPGLTDWDQAFLKSFYASEQKSVMERSQIAHRMMGQLAP